MGAQDRWGPHLNPWRCLEKLDATWWVNTAQRLGPKPEATQQCHSVGVSPEKGHYFSLSRPDLLRNTKAIKGRSQSAFPVQCGVQTGHHQGWANLAQSGPGNIGARGLGCRSFSFHAQNSVQQDQHSTENGEVPPLVPTPVCHRAPCSLATGGHQLKAPHGTPALGGRARPQGTLPAPPCLSAPPTARLRARRPGWGHDAARGAARVRATYLLPRPRRLAPRRLEHLPAADPPPGQVGEAQAWAREKRGRSPREEGAERAGGRAAGGPRLPLGLPGSEVSSARSGNAVSQK